MDFTQPQTPLNKLLKEKILEKKSSFLDPYALDIAIKAVIFKWSDEKIKRFLIETYNMQVSRASVYKYKKNEEEFLKKIAGAYLDENPGNPAWLVLNTPEKKMQGVSRALKSVSVSAETSLTKTQQQIEDFVAESEKARKKEAFRKIYEAVTPDQK